MKRLESRKDLNGYTLMKDVLINLELTDKDYIWLISDIEAYPSNKSVEKEINENGYLLLSTKELISMLEEEDFQWIWAVFSAIPNKYSKEEILKSDLPYIEPINPKYDPFNDLPKIQHPLAEFEICAWDSSGMFIVSDNEDLLNKFRMHYPLYIDRSEILFDDWETRDVKAVNFNRKMHVFVTIFSLILLLSSIIFLFFIWEFVLLLILSLIVFITNKLEWLKIKNNHIVIKKDYIVITNRFNKSKLYSIDFPNITLELKHSFDYRSGGIILKFYDCNNNLICKYEDMINRASPFGFQESKWERQIKSLGIKIIDPSEIIKN